MSFQGITGDEKECALRGVWLLAQDTLLMSRFHRL